MKDISYRVALGGIVSALCIVSMFLAGIIPALYIVMPMIAGVLMMFMAVEVNIRWAVLTYIAVGLLSLFVTFDKESALIFIMFFGHYPILRFFIIKIKSRLLRTIIKFACFNLCIIAFFYTTVYLFGLKEMLDEINEFGKYGSWILLAVADFIFVLYDYNLDIIYTVYRKRLMPKFRKMR